MRNKLLVVIGIMLFALGQIGVNFLIYKYKNKNTEIPKVQLRDIEENKKDKKKSFAIMLEQDDGSYTQTPSNSFDQPGYVFNTEKSGCIDINGNKIANSLSYNNTTKSIVVSVSSTAYCYAYFDKELLNGNALIAKSNLNNEGGLYRYQGTTADNYICFGTSTKATCTGDTDKYMYRIMGVNSSGQMKLIKKEALNRVYAWDTSNERKITWVSSTLYTGLNGDYFLNNATYVPSGWSSRIATTNWKYGDNTNKNVTALNLYTIENRWPSVSAKIGLMYAHDYAYGLSGGNNCSGSGTYSTCKTSWMHLSNNDSGVLYPAEWIIPTATGNSSASAWDVSKDGRFSSPLVGTTESVRPVFFLNNTGTIVSGTGTISDPYILSA